MRANERLIKKLKLKRIDGEEAFKAFLRKIRAGTKLKNKPYNTIVTVEYIYYFSIYFTNGCSFTSFYGHTWLIGDELYWANSQKLAATLSYKIIEY